MIDAIRRITKKTNLTVAGLAGLASLVVASAVYAQSSADGPIVRPKVKPALTLPLGDLPLAAPPSGEPRSDRTDSGAPTNIGLPGTELDPLVQLKESETRSLERLGAPILNIPGMGGANPNDTNGDVGPDHFVQMINAAIQVFDKQGNSLMGPVAINSLWSSAPAGQTECTNQNLGDPIVLYDRPADRWLLSQFARNQSGNNSDPGYICVAISQTGDPTGAFYLYQFEFSGFPDYFKFGAWPDGYYVSANLNGPNVAMAAVIDRVNMLNGNPAGSIEFSAPTLINNFDILIPSHMEGPTPPPDGTPNYMYRQCDDPLLAGCTVAFDHLELWEFEVNWAFPGASSFNGPTIIPTAPFDLHTCGYDFVSCVPQPGSAVVLDPIQNGTMYRFPYRNFGDREVMLGNFAVDATGADEVGIRWFVLERTPGNPWAIQQEGTYAVQPAGAAAFIHRWMASLTIDRFGNIAMGHTASSSQIVFPSARYTGRAAGDPPGIMTEPERTIQAGQSATTGNRWGDYYTMSVDPVDDCTFWYTGDHTAASGRRQSRIASFRFADCAADLVVTKTADPDPVLAGEQLTYTIHVTNDGPLDAHDIIVVDSLPDGVVYLADSVPAPECDVAGQIVTCEIGNLDVGEWTSFTITTEVDSDILQVPDGPTTVDNLVEASAAEDDANEADNAFTLSTLVNESADLAVSKVCKPDGPAPAGTGAHCDILVDNFGPSGARNVTLTDDIFSNGDYEVTSLDGTNPGACSGLGTNTDVSCDIGYLDAGERWTLTVNFTSDDAVDINDKVTVTSDTPDPNPANNMADGSVTFVGVANLSIVKSDLPDAVVAGETLQYTLDVHNAGPSTAMNVVVADQVPAGTTMLSATVTLGTGSCVIGVAGDPLQPTECGLGNLASGADGQVTIEVLVLSDTTGLLHNDATVSSDSQDDDNSDNRATQDTTIEVQTELVLTKTDGNQDPVAAGDELKYLLMLVNNGPSTATGVQLVDTLPLQTSLVDFKVLGGTDDCNHSDVNPDVVTCNVGSLDPGAKFILTITVGVDPSLAPAAAAIENCATVTEDPTADEPNDGASACETTDVLAEADLWIDKTGSYITQNPGKNIIYTLTVHNDSGCSGDDPQVCGDGGPSDAQNVTVIDTLPVDSQKLVVTFTSEDCDYDEPSHTVTCVTPVLAAGDSVVHEIEATPRGRLRAIDNTATVTSDTSDPNAGNNSDTKTLVVGGGGQKGTGE